MGAAEIDEPVSVYAVFTESGMKPLVFSWSKRDYKIARVTAAHRSRQGESWNINIAVEVHGSEEAFEMKFSMPAMTWRLMRIHGV